jgi:hypothetical protein
MECPSVRGFETRNLTEGVSCVYKDRPSFKLLLKTAPTISIFNNQARPTLETLKAGSNPSYQEFADAKDDYDKNMPILLSQIDRDTQLTDAFRQLQTAENARDQSPQGYQEARVRYYTLLKGDSWINEESQRVAAAEAVPKVTQYTQIKDDLSRRLNQQKQTIDVVNAVKDKVLSMKDDFAYTTNTFSKQISELKNQINIEKKKSEQQKVEVFSWLDMVLNVVITILVLGLLVAVIRKLIPRTPPKPTVSVYTPTK